MRLTVTSLRRNALVLVQAAYNDAWDISRLPLEALNRVRPPDRAYRSHDEVLEVEASRATGLATFAVTLGLIAPEQALQMLVEFNEKHPDAGLELPATLPDTDETGM